MEAVQKTTNNGKLLQQALGVSDGLLEPFAKIVYHYTGGIPRFVCRAFESLFVVKPILQDPDAIEMVFTLSDSITLTYYA